MNRTLSPAALKCGVCFLVCAFLLHFTAFYADCSALKDSCLRLHVIASSDGSADQRRKLLVRDAVLKAGGALFDGSVRAAEAEEKIRPALSTLEQAAEKTLRQHGSDETVTITVGKEYFPVRTYDDLTLPAGMYEAVKVVIGEGTGHNWWCVMFPPLCLPAAEKAQPDDYWSEEQQEILRQPVKYQARLKIVEWIEKLLK